MVQTGQHRPIIPSLEILIDQSAVTLTDEIHIGHIKNFLDLEI